jgi:hypothetical protein
MQTALLWLCIGTASVVFGLMLYSIATYPSPPGCGRHRPVRLLIGMAWAAVPIVIMVTAAMPALRQAIGPGGVDCCRSGLQRTPAVHLPALSDSPDVVDRTRLYSE